MTEGEAGHTGTRVGALIKEMAAVVKEGTR